MNKTKQLEGVVIETGLKVARRGEGAIFVIGDAEYDELVDQEIPGFKVINNPKLLESLALMDGAVIIDKKGMLKAYGVRLKGSKVLKNHGTRHAAALGAAKNGNTVILVSQEDRQIKIFRNKKLVIQIDALKKGVEKSVPVAVDLLESVGAGTLGTIGAGLLVPAFGIALLPGLVVFGSAYYIGKKVIKRFKKE